MKVQKIELVVEKFKELSNPTHRYTSFDYCYNYFKKRNFDDIEKSCLSLGFYLASWGMYRGSSFLLQENVKYLQPTVEYIANLDKAIWNIDVDNYNETNINIIIEIYKDIKNLIIKNNNADLTLITKILLGVFGFIPAFDRYFCTCFREISQGQCGYRTVNKNSLLLIKKFYDENKQEIDSLASRTYTIDFLTEKKTNITYPKAKIIDMYGFTKGLSFFKK